MSDHKIQDIKVHIVNVPTKTIHSHGSGDIAGIKSILLEITTDSGITGWGEASPWPVFTGTAEANAAALHVHLRPHLIGQDPVLTEKHLFMAEATLVDCPEAKAALETALLDITGQIYGLSISELVGGRHRDKIPLSFSVANPDFDKDLNDIDAMYQDGVRILKLKTGFAGHDFDVMRLNKLRDKYGDTLNLRIDYNQGLPAFDAIRRLKDLEAFDLDFIEQPVKMHERAAFAAITRAIDTPLMADESVFNAREAVDAVHNQMCDVITLKIMKSGGIRRAQEVAAIARTAGIEVYGGCMFETSIAHAAGTHLVASLPDLKLGCEFYMSTYYAKEDLLVDPFPVKDGFVHVPTAPGLGVTINPETLAKYTLETLG